MNFGRCWNLIFCINRKWMQGGQYRKNTRIEGKVAVITGANSGIGKETAVDLARRGGKVYIACRDIKRGEDALKEIKERSESDNVHFLQLDLSSMESIRQFSKKFHELENHLHILVNNAGVMAIPKAVTKDGFEMQIGTNHMGHFLLTNLLLDVLKQSSPSRIINVSSLFHWYGRINKEDLNSEKSYWRWIAYGQSKLANILFTRELSKRLEGTGVTVNAVHPGAVRTGLTRDVDMLSKLELNFYHFYLSINFFYFIFKNLPRADESSDLQNGDFRSSNANPSRSRP